MLRLLKILALGIIFGIVLAKAEIISWFRIYEMFHFQSFHMYGVIGSAVVLGIILVQIIKKYNIKTIDGDEMDLKDKDKSVWRYLLGGSIFGLGWALVGACPGPMFILLGYGYTSLLIVIAGAVLGTFFYGVIRNKLPH